jgi:hypothetical protein
MHSISKKYFKLTNFINVIIRTNVCNFINKIKIIMYTGRTSFNEHKLQ